MKKELEALKQKMSAMETDFSDQTDQLKREIERLSYLSENTSDTSSNTQTHNPWLANDVAQSQAVVQNQITSSHITSAETEKAARPASTATTAASIDQKTETSSQPTTVDKQTAIRYLFAFIATISPLANAVDKLVAVYKYYQAQGKAPVFFMTTIGIIALLLGCGYLLQYSVNHFLSDTAKMIMGFLLAIGVSTLGIWMTQKRPSMAEYGAAIMALGISLGYLCAYFAGPYYHILPAVPAFFLLAVITLIAYVLAYRFETRVVSVISLLGGAFTPIIIDQQPASDWSYFAYLWILSAATLSLSHHIRWPMLAKLMFVVAIGMVEWSLLTAVSTEFFNPVASITMGCIIVHSFFYLFSAHILKQLAQSDIHREDMTLLAANIAFLLIALYQVVGDSPLLGWLYLANGIVFGVLTFVAPQLHRYHSDIIPTLRSVGLMITGALVGVAILALVSPQLSGLVWGVEGLLLLHLGFLFKDIRVRQEAYGLCILSIAMMSFTSIHWISQGLLGMMAPHSLGVIQLSVDHGWFNLLGITALVYAAIRLLETHSDVHNAQEKILPYRLQECLSVLYVTSFIFTLAIFAHTLRDSDVIGVLIIIPLFYSLYRAQRYQLPITEYMALSLYSVLLIGMGISAQSEGNFHFSEQSWLAKIMRVEAFLCLWLIAEYYRRYFAHSTLAPMVARLRTLFFLLIPLLFLPKLWRSAPAFFPLGLWLSVVISLMLYLILRYHSLRHELYALALGATVVSVIAAVATQVTSWQVHVLPAILVGNSILLGILWYWRGLHYRPTASEDFLAIRQHLKPLMVGACYFLGVSLLMIVYGISDSLSYGVIAYMLYFTTLVLLSPVLAPIRQQLLPSYLLVSTAMFGLLLLYVISLFGFSNITELTIINVIGLLCFSALVYKKTPQTAAIWRKLGGQHAQLWVFHLFVILFYNILCIAIFKEWNTPALSITLVVHGTWILFQTVKPRYHSLLFLSIGLYLSSALKIVLLDMNGFSTVQKVIVFIGIGLVLLVAAYGYQRLRSRMPSRQPL